MRRHGRFRVGFQAGEVAPELLWGLYTHGGHLMKLALNLSVVTLLSSLVAVAGCSEHDKKAAPAAVTTSIEAPASTAGTTHAAATPETTAVVTPAVVKSDSAGSKSSTEPKAKATKGDSSAMSVKRLVVARGVLGREPKDPGTAFWKGDFDRLYAFVEVANPQKQESHIVVTFVPPAGKAAKGNVSLAVGASPRWRTWATSRAVDEKGTWTAVVSTDDGRELAREPFEIL